MRGAKADLVSVDWHVLECDRPTATEHCWGMNLQDTAQDFFSIGCRKSIIAYFLCAWLGTGFLSTCLHYLFNIQSFQTWEVKGRNRKTSLTMTYFQSGGMDINITNSWILLNNMTINDSRSLQRLKTVAVYHTCSTSSKVSSLENMQQLALDTKNKGHHFFQISSGHCVVDLQQLQYRHLLVAFKIAAFCVRMGTDMLCWMTDK